MLDLTQFSQNLTVRDTTAAPQPVPPAARPASLSTIIGRIEQAVEEETIGIKTDIDFDIKASNARKSRYLYELTKAMKGVGAADLIAEHRAGIVRLREKLARNEAAILAHLNAVNEVATLMQNAIQRAENDGTYSAGEFGRAGSA